MLHYTYITGTKYCYVSTILYIIPYYAYAYA